MNASKFFVRHLITDGKSTTLRPPFRTLHSGSACGAPNTAYAKLQIYKTRAKKFPGTEFREVHRPALDLYTEIKRKSKRRTYIRSAYFDKEKAKFFDFGISGQGANIPLKTKRTFR